MRTKPLGVDGMQPSAAPIIVYQMGKVGSSTVMASLLAMGLPNPVFHAHFLSRQGLAEAEAYYARRPHAAEPLHLHHSRYLAEQIEKTRGRLRWKIVSLVRDPVARTISDAFQNLTYEIPEAATLSEEARRLRIEAHLRDCFAGFSETTDYVCTWFDREIQTVFGVDVFAHPFDPDRGHALYRAADADLLVIRLENLSNCAEEAFAEFLGRDGFRLIKDNAADQKPYRDLYQRVTSRFSIPEPVRSRIYGSRFATHFYSPRERDAFSKRWAPAAPKHPVQAEPAPPGLATKVPEEGKRPDAPRFPASGFAVTAIVSVYGAERFMAGRIENLMDQRLFAQGGLEIVVIDAASPENERGVVAAAGRGNDAIRYYRTPERETVYAAWSRGVRLARGRFVVNANADDRFSDDALERLARALDDDPSVDAVYGDWLMTETENDAFSSQTPKTRYRYPAFHPAFLFYMQVTSHAVMVRRDVVARLGYFDGRYKVFGDREFLFRFAEAGHRAKKIDGIVGLYLNNPESLERSVPEAVAGECVPLYQRFAEPARFARISGLAWPGDPNVLARAYAAAGSLGHGLYGPTGHALKSAAFLLGRALALDPDHAGALIDRAVIAASEAQWETASRFLDAARDRADPALSAIIDHNRQQIAERVTDAAAYRWIRDPDLPIGPRIDPIGVHLENPAGAAAKEHVYG